LKSSTGRSRLTCSAATAERSPHPDVIGLEEPHPEVRRGRSSRALSDAPHAAEQREDAERLFRMAEPRRARGEE
jgi:hypothetical protein